MAELPKEGAFGMPGFLVYIKGEEATLFLSGEKGCRIMNLKCHKKEGIMKAKLLFLVSVVLFVIATSVLAAPLQLIPYTKKTTLAYPKDYTLRFSLCDDPVAGSCAYWSEEKIVSMTNAKIMTNLGDTVALSGVDFSQQYYVQVEKKKKNGIYKMVGARDMIGVVPYAMWSATGGEGSFVRVSGDTMTGPLNLPANGLVAGTNQFVLTGGNVGIGTSAPVQKLEVDGNVMFSKATGGMGALVLRTPSLNDPGRYGFRWENNTVAPFVGDDMQDMYYGFFSGWSNARTYDAHLHVHGKATNNWGAYIELTHDGSHGIISTDVGNINLTPALTVLIPNGRDLIFAGTPDDAGDIIFQTASGGQKARIWSNTNAGLTGLFMSSGDSIADLIINPAGGVQVMSDLTVSGNLTKGSGSFKIDHPTEPENKYLYHSFVESPDMMNVYNGNVILNDKGEACIQLPEWFESLNRDFRYQLTAVGAPGPNLFIAEKISSNKFKIGGGNPGMEVSWQVTGIRKDPYANAHRITVEEEKLASEKGYYLHPEAYGQPKEKGIDWARRNSNNNMLAETKK